MSLCDLHIHSRCSARSEEWLFRRFDFPDSYSEPRDLHRELKSRGMDFVTITDHDTIEGCLQISDLPDTFLSEQITTYFPQDPCKINLLAWGITEAQHSEIVRLRDNIFDLQAYLQKEEIVHAVAHPLYSINGKLEASHLERLILLFKRFEGLNGLRDALLSDLAQRIFGNLSPEKIEELANRHDLAPTHAEPWKKVLTAGSDDHGGKFVASACTETAAAGSAAEFLAHVWMSGKIFELAKPANMSIWKALSRYFTKPQVKAMLARELNGVPEPERRTFLMANLACEQFAFRLFEKFIQQIRTGNVVESIQAISGIAPILIVLAPYIYGFHSQAPSRRWLRDICLQLTGEIPKPLQNRKRAWFTDTLEDVNGVATTIRKMTAAGNAAGEALTVVTSRKN